MSELKYYEAVKKIRMAKLMNISEFARELKVHPASIINWETGKRKPKFSNIRSLLSIAKSLKLDIKPSDFIS